MTFSIVYCGRESGDDAYAQHAVDWDWNIKGKWAMSLRQGLGTMWDTAEGLDDNAYRAILQHFGLEGMSCELPAENIITMSPDELGRLRRRMEMEKRLPYKEIISDTIGDHARII